MPPTARSEKKSKKPAAKPQPPRVLLVEDEPALVEVVNDIVGRGMGCRVIAAGNIERPRRSWRPRRSSSSSPTSTCPMATG
jgi:hypothetical protein